MAFYHSGALDFTLDAPLRDTAGDDIILPGNFQPLGRSMSNRFNVDLCRTAADPIAVVLLQILSIWMRNRYIKMCKRTKTGSAIMQIKRDIYLQQLVERKDNGMIKVITGIRRCGKSFLLFNIYKD